MSDSHSRGLTAMNGAGLGVDRPAELSKSDDEYDAYRKRMMLAYRFRPNPLVTCFILFIICFKCDFAPFYCNICVVTHIKTLCFLFLFLTE